MDTTQEMICEDDLPFQATPKQSVSIDTAALLMKQEVLTPATMNSSPSSSYAASPMHQSAAAGKTSSVSSANSTATSTTVRVPMPSPTRPRLDPRYAARLPPAPLLHQRHASSTWRRAAMRNAN